MLSIRDAVNNFVDYIDCYYQGRLYYEVTHRFRPFCESETVGVSMTISADVSSYDTPRIWHAYSAASHQQYFKITVIFENEQSSSGLIFTINGSDSLTEFLSVFACFMCLNNEDYLDSYELFTLLPDKVDLSYIIRVIEIDHNVELLSRMIEDIYHYCRDGSYKKHIGALLDHFTSTEHNNPELTAVILNKRHELGIVNEDVPRLML